MGYFSKAWESYRDNFVTLAGIGIASVLTIVGLEFAGLGIFTAYIALFANILAYKAIEGKIDWKTAAVQSFWAWMAQIIVAIGAVLAVIVSFIPALFGGAAGIGIAVILVLAVLTVLLRFIFIPYFAHRGYGIVDMVKKSWERGWGPAIVVGLEVLAVIIVAMLVAGAFLVPVGTNVIHAMKAAIAQAQGMPVNAAKAMLYKTALQELVSPQNLVMELLAVAAYGAITPLAWLIIYFGGKGDEDEKSVGETAEEMA